jgi:ACT domain-containing protein
MSKDNSRAKALLIKKLLLTPLVEVACKQANVARSTYYRWRKVDQKFADAANEALEISAGIINDLAESQLIAAIKDQNLGAITFWLRNNHTKYSDKLKLTADIQVTNQLTEAQEASITKVLLLADIITGDIKSE